MSKHYGQNYGSHGYGYGKKCCGSCKSKPKKCCNPCGSKYKQVIKWPPVHPNDQYSHIYVPGHFKSVQKAVSAITYAQNNHENTTSFEDDCPDLGDKFNENGYVIHLGPGTHVLYRSHTSDIKFIRFQGDVNVVKGVGYFHELGNWGDYEEFSNQFDTCIGGSGPFFLSVDCNKIKVKGCRNPDYSGLRCGDKLTFYHSNGKCTNHVIKSTCNNQITVMDRIPICGCVRKGEGFFVRPNVTLKMCPRNGKTQKFTVEHRLEYAGLNLEIDSKMLVTGATGGYTEIEHCVVEGDCGMLVHVGMFDWYKPNVFLTELVVNDGSGGGEVMLQTFVGCLAKLTLQSNQNIQFWFAVFVDNDTAVNLINGGNVSTFSSDFCNCEIGTSLQAGSKHAIVQCRFMGCVTGVSGNQNSHISGLPILRGGNEQAPLFVDCELAINIVNNCHMVFRAVIMPTNSNTIALHIDTDTYVDLASYTTAEKAFNNSVAYYDILIISLIPV
uniref:Beta-helix protein n=1 Tax=Pithovirus LCPAC001 TaxID=2506585 RepID=A0A481Z1H2_9VIRU|nr:MAG: beta-helix protein [Pithovirus LCPAC001]